MKISADRSVFSETEAKFVRKVLMRNREGGSRNFEDKLGNSHFIFFPLVLHSALQLQPGFQCFIHMLTLRVENQCYISM